MEQERWFLRDPKLPAINAAPTGNGMEGRRCTAPLPQSLSDTTGFGGEA